jgi:thiol-disulfide isomerase/thioredoxin
VLAIAIAATVGWFVQKRLSARSAPVIAAVPVEAPAATTATGTPPTAGDASLAPKSLPETLPQFELMDRAGKLRKLGEWKGKPLIVNYWATWCAPCVREIPLLSQLRRERASQKLEVIGIAVDFRDDVLKFADAHALDYPLLIGEEEGLAAVSAVGMQPAFPFTLFADSQQRIVAMKVGELHREEATLILDRVAAVDAGSLGLDQAREQIREGLKDLATRRALEEAKPAGG